jgi:hypothetical protein
MDATVFTQGRGIWHVNASPTMRSLGDLLAGPDRTLTIVPDDEGSALHGVNPGPYATVEEAMAAIGAYLKGQCRHARQRAGGYR